MAGRRVVSMDLKACDVDRARNLLILEQLSERQFTRGDRVVCRSQLGPRRNFYEHTVGAVTGPLRNRLGMKSRMQQQGYGQRGGKP